MSVRVLLLSCVCKAAVKHLVNLFTLGVGGDLIADAWEFWQRQSSDAQRRAEIEGLATAPQAEVKKAAAQVIRQEASHLPADQQRQLEQFLVQTPAAIRRTLRRPGDPTGRSAVGLRLGRPEDLAALLPSRAPRFQSGDRPLPGVDWELVELLGVGGFGEVWKARNPRFPGVAPVALKFCLDPQARDRLLSHEAAILDRVMRQGKHPGIVPLLHTYLSANPPCLEYEYVSGGDLTGVLRDLHQTSKVDVAEVTRLVTQLAGIAGFAHQQGIVHRDLKPGNVLVQKGERGETVLRVADFGIGGLVPMAGPGARKGTVRDNLTTAVAGSYSPLYASPQQQKGDQPDPRDDVYALGVIWYQLLSGDLTEGAPTGEAWKRRLTESGVSPALLTVLVSCLEHRAADRPANGGAVHEAIRKASQPEKTARQTASPTAKVPPPPPPVPAKLKPSPSRRRSRWGLALGLSVGMAGMVSVVLALGVGTWFLMRNGGESREITNSIGMQF